MKGLLRRIRGGLGLGVIWAGGGAAIGALIELLSNIFPGLPVGFIDMWIPMIAIPGFLGGVIFSTVLRVVAGRRRLDELSLPGMAALGAVGGVLLGGVMMGLGVSAFIMVPATVLSAVAASLTLAFARMGEDRDLLEAGADAGEVGLTASERKELLG